ncbi:MAG: dihydroorotate dehydrogenase, partial [Candidatus Saccharibacteria bacterium]
MGLGGIMNTRDALEFIMAGATAISIGTANFVNPRVSKDIIEGLERYMESREITDINQLVGAAHPRQL